MASSSSMPKKESRGRQKIKMAKIKNPSHRQVTFSKRRLGLFKKASELCTLCGVEATIIVFSPGQKMFSFGQPDVDSIVDRYLNQNQICPNGTTTNSEGGVHQGRQLSGTTRKLNSQLSKIQELQDSEKTRSELLNNLKKIPSQNWWEQPVDYLGLNELETLKAALENLNMNVANQAHSMVEKTSSTPIQP
ncbi:agamous-like MADS-box protein AGL62 [Chenopodium quinoa]|uniref:MADS-box domain-containing protein n=1 Tax=Chenopodium quinoa TaxID=63459 RepID=A0A803L8R2_CHEQI|nr:agamous-like MADS-box protein AGL62 [Chenopodium quinoa]